MKKILHSVSNMYSVVPSKGVKFKYVIGEKVLCYEPDPAKTKVLYESKVLDLVAGQEGNGRRRAEYLVHFCGWGNNWDRCVREDWVLPMTDENQELQRRLVEEAAIYLQGRCRIPPFFKSTLSKINNKAKEKPEVISDPDSSDLSEDETEKEVIINIPKVLKLQLEEDWRFITQKNKLVAIPCYPNIVAILEGFVKHSAAKIFCEPPPRNGKQLTPEDVRDKLGLYKETVDGLRVYFDFTLPHLLLYGQEKKQHYSHCSTARPHRDHHEIALTSLKVEPPSSDPEYSHEREAELVVIKQEPSSPKSAPKRGRPRLRRNMPKDNSNLEAVNHLVVKANTTSVGKRNAKRNTTNHPPVVKATTSRNRDLKSVANKNSAISKAVNLKEQMVQKRKRGRPKTLPTRVLRSSHVPPVRRGRPPVKKMLTVSRKAPAKRKRAKTPFPQPIIIKTEPCEDRITRRGSVQARIAMEKYATANKFCTPQHFSDHLTNEPKSFECRITRQRSIHSRLSMDHQFIAPSFPSPCVSRVGSSGSSNHIQGGTAGIHRLQGLLKDVLGWKLLPTRVWEIVPAEPSLMYGAQHLLRLFVKLPDLISKMRIPNRKLQPLLDILNQFLAYMQEQKEKLFLPSAYVDSAYVDK